MKIAKLISKFYGVFVFLILILLVCWLWLKPIRGVCFSLNEIPTFGKWLPSIKVGKIEYQSSWLRSYSFAKMWVSRSEAEKIGFILNNSFITSKYLPDEKFYFSFADLDSYEVGGPVSEFEDVNFMESGNLLNGIYFPIKGSSNQVVLYLFYKY